MFRFQARTMCISFLIAPAPTIGQEVPLKDGLGDPLPPFAAARLGTQRLRHNHNGHVGAIAFSPDGKTMATGANDVRIWDVATGKQIRTIPVKDAIKSVDYSADGKTLIGAGVFTQAFYLFDADTGVLKHSIGKLPFGRESVGVDDTEAVRPLSLSADGKLFAAPFTENAKLLVKTGGPCPTGRNNGCGGSMHPPARKSAK